jgi:acetyl-CoA synthetase
MTTAKHDASTPSIYPVLARFNDARIQGDDYSQQYKASLENADAYWSNEAQRLIWHKPFESVNTSRFTPNDVKIEWFKGGELNVCENCVDRHALAKPDAIALIWEPDHPSQSTRNITYQELYQDVQRCANMLKALGANANEPITIYMPMIPEAVIAMLACSRLGVPHSVVFGGFSPKALRERIEDCGSKIVITANEGRRGGKAIPLKANVDTACQGLDIHHVLVFEHSILPPLSWQAPRDIWWHELASVVDANCPPVSVDAEHPLFVLYTSGSTGKPKGLQHSSAGYLLYAQQTFENVFDYKAGEVFWCTADIGWVTGHSYMVYGPLSAGATTLLFEGVPTFPDVDRFWQVIEKHKVNLFYTAPTALRTLMKFGNEPVEKYDLSTLRILGSVGEPINAEAWEWYYHTVGKAQCAIVDTYWQTETGGHLLTPLVGVNDLKPGAALQPYFGVEPALLSPQGELLSHEAGQCSSGALCIKQSWPGQARTIWGDHARFEATYFSSFPNYYFTGDLAHQDEDGDFWIEGRMDDVINVSGHRLGTAEIESTLDEHPAVVESAVVAVDHELKGQGIYAFVILKTDESITHSRFKTELNALLRQSIGAIAHLEQVQITPQLPKTRSGKIMRRILRKIANGDITSKADYHKLGDTSTLLDPSVVDELVFTFQALNPFILQVHALDQQVSSLGLQKKKTST